MNDNDFFSDFEKTIKNTVDDIKQSSDFQNIKRSAKDLGEKMSKEINNGVNSAKKAYNSFANSNSAPRQSQNVYAPSYKKPTHSVSSVLLCVFGGLFAALGAPLFLLLFLGFLVAPEFWVFRVIVIMALITIGGIVMLVIGIRDIKRISRYKKYLYQFYGKEFIPLSHLAGFARVSEDVVYSDINDMLAKQYILKAVFDSKHEYVFFSDEVYEQYLKACQTQAQKQKEARKRARAQKDSQVISDGWDNLNKLGEIIQRISDVSVRQKSSELYDTAQKIMDFITENTDRADEIKKLSSYYLPSTVNILNTYLTFEEKDMDSEDIRKAKAEIENMLDVSQTAFKNILSSLYDDDAMDVSTDIAAMQAMMAQEGLIDSFEIKKK